MKRNLLFVCIVVMMLLAFAMPVSAAQYGDLYYEVIDGEVKITGCVETLTDKNMVIPETIEGYPVTVIGNGAFRESSDIVSVTLPDSVKEIGDSAFYGCFSLKSLNLPEGLETIGDFAFQQCVSLEELNISKNVTSIGTGAIACRVNVDEDNSNYSSDNYNALYDKNKTTLISYPQNNTYISYDVPETVETIIFAAINSEYLKTVTIPDSVKKIEGSVFYNNDNLKSVIVYGTNTVFADNTVEECENVVFYGHEGSTAEAYAVAHNIPFSLIAEYKETSFEDIPADAWYKDYVDKLVELGIIAGKSDGTFAPDELLKRCELVKMLAVASGDYMPMYDWGGSYFDDCANHWSSKYVNWAYENGIVNGRSETIFDPDAAISRQEAAKMINAFADYENIDLSSNTVVTPFLDNEDIADWARPGVFAMHQSGVIHGYEVTGGHVFRPEDTAKRCEAAKMVSVLLDLKNK